MKTQESNDTAIYMPHHDDTIYFHIIGHNMSDFDSVHVVIRPIGYVNETAQEPIHICQPQKYTEGKVCFLMTASFILGFLLCLVITWIRS